MTDGTDLIRIERERQILELDFTPSADEHHAEGELVAAARCYLDDTATKSPTPPASWPWAGWWKPADDPVRNLEKAGALIAAEIDRRRRLGAKADTWQPMVIDQSVMLGVFVGVEEIARPWAKELEENLGNQIKRVLVRTSDGTRGDITYFTDEPHWYNWRRTETVRDVVLVPAVPPELLERLHVRTGS